MNQQGLIVPVVIGLALLIIIGGGAAWYVTRPAAVEDASTVTEEEVTLPVAEDEQFKEEAEPGESRFSGRLADLIKQGKNLTCTFNRDDAAGVMAGTIYVAGQGQRVGGNFQIQQTDGQVVNSQVRRDGDYYYFWSDQMPQGVKMSVTGQEQTAATADSNASQQWVTDENFKYDCEPWVVEAGVFELPAGIEFVDVSQQLQPVPAAAGPVQEMQCASCDELVEPGKSQCRQALGCV